jgi:hypothetical protein
MRYFLISYYGIKSGDKAVFGEYTISCKSFFNKKELLNMIQKDVKLFYSPTILNIFEFKNEEDYNNFIN